MIRLVLTRAIAADLGLLVLRVFTGALLIHHGYEKLANIENSRMRLCVRCICPSRSFCPMWLPSRR